MTDGDLLELLRGAPPPGMDAPLRARILARSRLEVAAATVTRGRPRLVRGPGRALAACIAGALLLGLALLVDGTPPGLSARAPAPARGRVSASEPEPEPVPVPVPVPVLEPAPPAFALEHAFALPETYAKTTVALRLTRGRAVVAGGAVLDSSAAFVMADAGQTSVPLLDGLTCASGWVYDLSSDADVPYLNSGIRYDDAFRSSCSALYFRSAEPTVGVVFGGRCGEPAAPALAPTPSAETR